MSAPISSNRYKFPSGYHRYISIPTYGAQYTPWNGYNNGANSPGSAILGAVTKLTIATVPANSSVSTFTDSFGRQFAFQFVYGATVPGANVIPVVLSAGGSSTAAQVTTAWLAALQSPAVDSNARTLFLPFIASQTGAAEITINWTVAGNAQNITLPAGITQTAVSASALSSSAVLPGLVGPLGATLPGA